jgi:hypothetical protein
MEHEKSKLTESIESLMPTATTSEKRSRPNPLGVFLGLAMLFLATEAKANTYLFSFTGQQALDALLVTEGATIFNKSGYFALFVQPDPIAVSNYSWVSQMTPNPGAPQEWTATTITDPANPNLGYNAPPNNCVSNCTWAQFSKQAGQTSVTMLSRANGGPGGANIFLNHTFQDNVAAPYGWGQPTATITSIMSESSQFQFIIDTPLTLPGNVTLFGYASELRSASSSSFPLLGSKEFNGIAFTLTAQVSQVVPEPGTWALFGGAAALLFGLKRSHKKETRSR